MTHSKQEAVLSVSSANYQTLGGLLISASFMAYGINFSPAAALQAASPAVRLAGRSAVQIAAADPTTSLPQAVITELNQLRTNPAAYAAGLEALRPLYDGPNRTVLRLPGEDPIQTREGVAALNDAIAWLRTLTPLPPLTQADGMSQGAHDHATDLSPINRLSSLGQDGSNPSDRISRYGTWQGQLTEILSYGRRTAQGVVLQWLVDDGDLSRSTRTSLVESSFRMAGAACHLHATQRMLCVVNAANTYTDAGALPVPAASASPASPAPAAPSGAGQNAASLPISEAIAAAGYLSPLEQAIVAETNRVRTNPAAYASRLEQLRPYYRDRLLELPGQSRIQVEEGMSVLDEAIADLRSRSPQPPLRPSQGMSLGAHDHVTDIGPKGYAGHYGTDGSDPFERIERYGTYDIVAGENISYGPINTAEWHVIQLLIDDGYPSRGHREAILRPDYRYMGVACGSHVVYRHFCVMTYAGDYSEGLQAGR